VHLNSPPKHKVASNTKDDKERAESDEVNIEICVLNIQLFKDIVAFLKDACTFAILLAFERFAVISIDCLQDALKRVSIQTSIWFVTLSVLQQLKPATGAVYKTYTGCRNNERTGNTALTACNRRQTPHCSVPFCCNICSFWLTAFSCDKHRSDRVASIMRNFWKLIKNEFI